ncbi:hypothetical protein CK203_061838 [Vitis vinifera]|uniref:Uncharacterized protein n=1 Tax=Vitis vinifera TaxID=29760 RepID=A0A438GC16_VITVI|nr:hypothetical protein CK203_061838 [Vitis vinifera]
MEENPFPAWSWSVEQCLKEYNFDDMLIKILLVATFISFILAYLHGDEYEELGFEVYICLWGVSSSYTALCTTLTTSVVLCHGMADSLFPMCLGFSLIVMRGVTGVRKRARMQVEVLARAMLEVSWEDFKAKECDLHKGNIKQEKVFELNRKWVCGVVGV